MPAYKKKQDACSWNIQKDSQTTVMVYILFYFIKVFFFLKNIGMSPRIYTIFLFFFVFSLWFRWSEEGAAISFILFCLCDKTNIWTIFIGRDFFQHFICSFVIFVVHHVMMIWYLLEISRRIRSWLCLMMNRTGQAQFK